MLFVIDVGNTNIVLGIFQDENLISEWRIRTDHNLTEDELSVLLIQLFKARNLNLNQITKVVISSVVPPMMRVIDSFCKKYIGVAPHWIEAKSITQMPIRYKNPAEIGADRLVNSIAAYQKYKSSLIVIDFGTATTFDAISQKGEYLGGAISPGIKISSEALYFKASKLPRVEIFSPPEAAIGKDTISSIQSGIILGYASLVDGMVERIQQELDAPAKVIATGGLAVLMKNVSKTIEAVEPLLPLEGLKIISHDL